MSEMKSEEKRVSSVWAEKGQLGERGDGDTGRFVCS